jgi:protein SCO1/2
VSACTRFPQARFVISGESGLWKSCCRGALGIALVAIAGCGGGGRELVGLTRDPAPVVDVAAVPDVSRDDEPFRFVAPDGGLLVVFFGYTHCPDVCPTTLADLRRAYTELGDDAGRVDTVMVTIDPERDRDVVTEYIQGFVDDAHAVALDDDAELQQLALSFGVSYQVDVRQGGRVDVVHSDTTLFAVDDTGTLVLTWPFGTKPDELAGDLGQLLDSDDT